MSLSSLQKKMNANKSLLFIFLVGLLSLTFLVLKVNKVFADTVAPVAPTSTSAITAQSVTYSWSAAAGFSGTAWIVASSTNRATLTVATSTPTSTVTYTFNGLATNTLYYFGAAGADPGAISAYATSSPIYTLADTPGTPTITSTAAQTMKVTINSSTNPAATTYIIRDTASSTRTLYLQGDQTWGTATATFVYTALGPVVGTTTIGLATNTLHIISVAAVNGAGVTTSYGTAAAYIYTYAATPAAPTVTSANPQRLTIVINAGGNPTSASTTFVVRDTVDPASTKYLQSNQTWSTATATFTYAQLGGASGTTTIGLATSSPHIISVAAVNGDTTQTSSYSSAVVFSTTPNTPTSSVSTAALTTFTVVINSSTNPTSTMYIVRDTGGATVKYLQSDSTWESTTATLSFTFVGGLVSTSTTGLTANTLHTIAVAAVSSDNTVTSSYGTAASIYTLANAPSSVALSATANGFTFSWSGDSGEEFWAEDITGLTNSGWITGTSYSIGGINCGTSHTFRVAGRNGDAVVTASSSNFSATTNACGSGAVVVSAPAATPATPAKPAVPGVSPAVPATPASVSLPSKASPVAVFVHTLGIGSKGAEVKQLQQTLRELGFFKHPTNTGLFGAVTKAAVVAFQKAQGFRTAPGVVGPATREALNAESAVSAGESAPPVAPAPVSIGEFVSNLKLGSRGEEVRMLQAKLRELGFFNHPTDTGLFGAVTRAAVVAFQKDQGFSSAPGVVGPATRAALNGL